MAGSIKRKFNTLESDPESDDDIFEDRVGDHQTSSALDGWNTRPVHKQEVVNRMLSKAVVGSDFDQKPLEDVRFKSDREHKKERKAVRESTKGKGWFNMPATELTEENRHDLELLRMRASLDPVAHYRKNQLKVLPKYFQKGKVLDNSADRYSSRLSNRERKQTLVDELLNDHEFLAKNKHRYTEIKAREAQMRRRRVNPMKRFSRIKKD